MIESIRRSIGVPQNLGLADRLLRFAIGILMIAIPVTSLVTAGSTAPINYLVILLSVYPILTGFLGWDPAYAALNVRTCGGSERNPCGTLPFEADAAMGRRPIPDNDVEHSLGASHHEPARPGSAGRR